MEDTDKSQEYGELSQICKLLPTLYPKLQPYSKTIERIKRQEGIKMGQRTLESIQGAQGENNKSTSSFVTKERRKVQSENRCFRSHYRRSTIPRTRWKVEANSISIKNDATCRKKLQDLQQRVTGNSGSSDQMEIVFVGCIGNI